MQMTLLNYVHYTVLGIISLFFLIGIISALRQSDKKLMFGMLVTSVVVFLFFAVFSVIVVDKYTKKAGLYKLKNHRMLSIEKIVYTGIVKNEGKFTIGKVKLEIKLVNKGHATGNVKGGNFYKASGFLDFFSGGYNLHTKPQTITKEVIVARNLKPGKIKRFRFYFDYPGYFRNVAQFSKLTEH
jgi:hypothetical protein